MGKITNKEIANVITHGIGSIIFYILIPVLLIRTYKYDKSMVFTTSLFCFGLMMVYSSSTIYHWITHHATKRILRILDHCSIYLLIAGTQSPLIYRSMPHESAVKYLIVLWAIVGIGIIYKIYFTGRYEFISILSYVLLAMFSMLSFKHIFNLPIPDYKMLLVVGGGVYLLGIIFYVWKWYKYHHAVWHVFVLGGSLLHYASIYCVMQ